MSYHPRAAPGFAIMQPVAHTVRRTPDELFNIITRRLALKLTNKVFATELLTHCGIPESEHRARAFVGRGNVNVSEIIRFLRADHVIEFHDQPDHDRPDDQALDLARPEIAARPWLQIGADMEDLRRIIHAICPDDALLDDIDEYHEELG